MKTTEYQRDFSHLMSGVEKSQDQEKEEENKTIREGFDLGKQMWK